MNTNVKPHLVPSWSFVPSCLAVTLLGVALPGAVTVSAQTSGRRFSPSISSEQQAQINTTATDSAKGETAAKLSANELESLVAPIALYPDPILVQVLAASTYPLEIIRLKQWTDKNKNLKGKELADAVAQQDWDPSVQGLSAFPSVVDKLANDIEWTTNLGNAFLAQQDDLMDAVQTLRAKAQANGALKSNDKQTVGTEDTNDGKQAITIEPAQRDVVYVPTYNTQYVYRDSGSSSSSSDSGDSGYSNYTAYSGDSGYSSGSDDGYSYLAYAAGAATGAAAGYYWGNYNWRDGNAEVNYKNYYNQNWNNKNNNWRNNGNNSNNTRNWSNNASNSNSNARNWSNQANNLNGSDRSAQRATQGTGKWQHDPSHRGNAPYANRDLSSRMEQASNRLAEGAGNRSSELSRANAGNQLARGNSARPTGSGSARPSTRPPNAGAPNRVGNRTPSNWPNTARGGAFGPSNGNLARSFSGRGAQSLGPQGGLRGGPPRGLTAGGPPIGGGFRGGPPGGGFPGGGPPMGGGLRPPMGGGPPMGGPPMGGAPPPPPGP